MSDDSRATWERRHGELWDRIFQVTQDVAALTDTMGDTTGGFVVRPELMKTAVAVGAELVRAGAAEDEAVFLQHVREARLKAIEADYWLRLAYILQQRDEVQRDLSSIITQYGAVIDLLDKMARRPEAASMRARAQRRIVVG